MLRCVVDEHRGATDDRTHETNDRRKRMALLGRLDEYLKDTQPCGLARIDAILAGIDSSTGEPAPNSSEHRLGAAPVMAATARKTRARRPRSEFFVGRT